MKSKDVYKTYKFIRKMEIYPRFTLTSASERGTAPCVKLPENLTACVRGFYVTGERERIEKYAEGIKTLCCLNVRLQWRDIKGLTNTAVGTQGAIELSDDSREFVSHNLGGMNSLLVAAIAQEYAAVLTENKR